jgi:hypothetical protein
LLPGVETHRQPAPYIPHQPNGGALAAIRRVYFDTAQCANPVAMKALRAIEFGNAAALFPRFA